MNDAFYNPLCFSLSSVFMLLYLLFIILFTFLLWYGEIIRVTYKGEGVISPHTTQGIFEYIGHFHDNKETQDFDMRHAIDECLPS